MNYAIRILQEELTRIQGTDPRRTNSEIQQMLDLERGIYNLDLLDSGGFKQPETFTGKIAAAINCHSLENGSDTPDFILAGYLKRCLENFDLTMQARVNYCGPDKEEVVEEKQYRMLSVGEIIESGDDMYSSNTGPWEPAVTNNVGTEFHHGLVPHRRPIVPEKQYRMLEAWEILQEGDECSSLKRGWVPTPERGIAVGEQYVGSYRRPVDGNEVRDAHGNTWTK